MTATGSMHINDLDYELPPDRIAQTPAARRSDSRLMVVDRKTRAVRHARFSELPDLLPTPAALFRNNASVFKARVPGRRPTGGTVECLLLRPLAPDQVGRERWECLAKPGKKLPCGATFGFEKAYVAEVLEKHEGGRCIVAFEPQGPFSDMLAVTDQIGEVPLPPYIRRENPEPTDVGRYQTVYADPRRKVAAAAPTAGLHFTPEILEGMARAGFTFHDLTLHVGLGTFLPVQAERLEDHPIHHEFYEIPAETREALHRHREAGTRIVAVGTTSLRAMEDFARARALGLGESRENQGFQREADLFITPPASFLAADSLITNFHLPKSTLLALVAAFLTPGATEGIAWIKELYSEAILRNYRFFSYGDAMLIL